MVLQTKISLMCMQSIQFKKHSFGSLICSSLVILILNSFDVFAQSSSRSEMLLSQSQYLGEAGTSSQSESYSDFALSLKGEKKLRSWTGVWDLKGLASLEGSEQAYIAVPQLHAHRRVSDILNTSIGRKLHNWSYFDKEWNLGIWEPQVRWDYIHPKPQGLIGWMFELHDSNWRMQLLLSPIYLPDQGPKYEIENGKISSPNRWFWEPQISAEISEQSTPIYYSVVRPKESEVIFSSGMAAQIQLGYPNEGPFMQMAYAYKPLNQIHLAVDAKLKASQIDATIYPQVVNHHVLSIESGYHGDEMSGWVSVTGDIPDKTQNPEEWLEASLSSSFFASASFSHRAVVLPQLSSQMKYSYLHRWDALERRAGGSVNTEVESSLDRFQFERVLSFEMNQDLWHKGAQSIQSGLRYLYSIPDRGALLSLQLRYQQFRNLEWRLAVDILGSESPSDGGPSDMLSRYRSNDRVVGGLSYVF